MVRYSLLGFLLTVALISCGGGKKDADEKGAVWGIGAGGLITLLEERPDTPIVDVRSAEEFEEGHIEGAIHADIDGPDFKAAVEGFDREAPIVVYSDGDARTLQASEILLAMGFKDISELLGGYESWAGYSEEE